MTYRLRILFAAMAAGLTVLSILPADFTPPTFGISDKIQHVVAYFVLTFVAASALPGSGRWWRVALPLVAMGALLEVAQVFVPGRYPEMADTLANALGVALGVALFQSLRRLTNARQTP